MKLITQIIEDLTEDDKSLNSSLLKTKILADKMETDSVFAWVNNELNGYSDIKILPEYRILPASATGTFVNRVQMLKNVPIPTMSLDEELKEFLTSMRISNSVSNLEHHISTDSGELGISIPLEFCQWINSQLDSNAYLQFGRVNVGRNMIVELLNNVRSRLLDFLLKIQREFKEDEFAENKTSIDDIFSGTIINSNVIFSGNNNSQSLTTKITNGNLEELKNKLRENSVSEKDIEEVEKIVKEEAIINSPDSYGPKMQNWLKEMLGKAIDGSWKISVNVASKFLTEVIKNYYGV